MPNSNYKKVLVALSGGVDSAVAAALLKKRGFEIFGIFFDFGKWGESGLNNAKKIVKTLGIPLEITGARKEFKKKVIDYFVSAYKKGVTPNPCVVCNKEIKFNLLFELMRKYKADYVATGHYARIKPEFSNIPKTSKNYILLEALDKSKDQSYFLYRLTQRELARIIFPLGDRKKSDIKKMAKKMGLPVAEEESQDICFFFGQDLISFLRKYLKPKPGKIVDEQGNILGRHEGLPFYTIGQRKRIEVGGCGPYYVIGKNERKNELIVSNEARKLLTKKFKVRQINWIRRGLKFPLLAKVCVRYHSPKVSAIIRLEKFGTAEVETKKYLRAVTPGQSAVFYRNNEVLGGAIIA